MSVLGRRWRGETMCRNPIPKPRVPPAFPVGAAFWLAPAASPEIADRHAATATDGRPTARRESGALSNTASSSKRWVAFGPNSGLLKQFLKHGSW